MSKHYINNYILEKRKEKKKTRSTINKQSLFHIVKKPIFVGQLQQIAIYLKRKTKNYCKTYLELLLLLYNF